MGDLEWTAGDSGAVGKGGREVGKNGCRIGALSGSGSNES